MNLTETLSQMQSPAFFTFYKQNNNKNVKKAGDRVWESVAVKFSSWIISNRKKNHWRWFFEMYICINGHLRYLSSYLMTSKLSFYLVTWLPRKYVLKWRTLEGKSFISLMDLKQAYISIELTSKSTTVGSTIV